MGKQRRSEISKARKRLAKALKDVARLDPVYLRGILQTYREDNVGGEVGEEDSRDRGNEGIIYVFVVQFLILVFVLVLVYPLVLFFFFFVIFFVIYILYIPFPVFFPLEEDEGIQEDTQSTQGERSTEGSRDITSQAWREPRPEIGDKWEKEEMMDVDTDKPPQQQQKMDDNRSSPWLDIAGETVGGVEWEEEEEEKERNLEVELELGQKEGTEKRKGKSENTEESFKIIQDSMDSMDIEEEDQDGKNENRGEEEEEGNDIHSDAETEIECIFDARWEGEEDWEGDVEDVDDEEDDEEEEEKDKGVDKDKDKDKNQNQKLNYESINEEEDKDGDTEGDGDEEENAQRRRSTRIDARNTEYEIPPFIRGAVTGRVRATWSENRDRVVMMGEDGRVLILEKPAEALREGGRERFSLREVVGEDGWSDWEGE